MAPEQFNRKMSELSPEEEEELIRFWTEEHRVPLDWTQWSGDLFDAPSMLDRMNKYDAEVAYTDSELSRIYRRFQEKGLNQSTLWIITSDHGEGLGNHQFMGHGKTIYQEQLRVPLLFCFPDGRQAGLQTEVMTRHVDLLPTVAELFDLPLPEGSLTLQGRSLAGLLNGLGEPPAARYAYSQRRPADEGRIERGWEPGVMYALQDRQQKYIHHTEGIDEFFDLTDDPFELHNLVDEQPGRAAEMKQLLFEVYEELSREGESVTTGEVGAEQLEELKSLGYL
jgi:arylsulfatase A-like enzyme